MSTISVIDADGRNIEVAVRRHPRSRSIRLSVHDDGTVRIIAPKRTPLAEIRQMVLDRTDWLAAQLARTEDTLRSTVVDLAQGGPARLLGEWIPVGIIGAARRGGTLDADGRLELRVPAGHDPWDVLVWWYRRHAREVIEARVRAWADLIGVDYERISIRDPRSRWGSCSSRGTLSFSWRLVLAPLWVLDAIVVHELCHRIELNHSDRFWALVQDIYPRHDEAQDWLRTRGALLRITRPATPAPAAAPPEPAQEPVAVPAAPAAPDSAEAVLRLF